jgi:HNH endonuclease
MYSASISHSLCVLLKFLIHVSSNSMSQWRSGQWGQMIEDDEPLSDIGDSKIHSIQNGLLLSQQAHSYFDKYMIAINPDVRIFTSAYKMVLMFSRTTTRSPVSLKTFGALMGGI